MRTFCPTKTKTILLQDSICLNGATYAQIVIRGSTEQDIETAVSRSQKMVDVPGRGLWTLTSPTLLALNILLQQIVSIGDMKGPFSISDLKRLSCFDFKQLCLVASNVDKTIH